MTDEEVLVAAAAYTPRPGSSPQSTAQGIAELDIQQVVAALARRVLELEKKVAA